MPPASDDFTPTGFFVIRARDLEEATALARSNPLLSMGGHLTVRQVDDLRWVFGAIREDAEAKRRSL